jgi:hypothetical protein
VAKLMLQSRKYLNLSLAAALLMLLIVQLPRLVDPHMIDEDFRNLYYVHRYSDPELFRYDPALGYQIAEIQIGSSTLIMHKLSPVYGLLFAAAAPSVEPILFAKLMAFPLLLLAVYYMFRITETILSPRGALQLSLFFGALLLLSNVSFGVVSGLQRSFMVPIILALVYYLRGGQYWAAAVALVVSVIYPPAFLLAVATYGLAVLNPSPSGWRDAIRWQQIVPLLVSGVIGVLTLLPAFSAVPNPDGGKAVETTASYSLLEPMLQEDGRYPLFGDFPLIGAGGLIDSGMDGLVTVVLVCLTASCWLTLRPHHRRLPPYLWRLFWASMICFALSWLAILVTSTIALHMPSRYTRFPIFFMALLFVWLNGREAIRAGARWAKGQGTRLLIYLALPVIGALAIILTRPLSSGFKLLFAVLLVALIALAVFSALRPASNPDRPATRSVKSSGTGVASFWPAAANLALFVLMLLLVNFFDPGLYSPPEEDLELLRFIETLPVDSVIAGNPCSLNNVPLFARRPILFSCETPNYDPQTMMDGMLAYYAQSGQEVADFCLEYSVDYLVVDEIAFTQEKLHSGKYLFEPFDSQLKLLTANRTQFALNQISDDAKLYANGSRFVISCDPNLLTTALGH